MLGKIVQLLGIPLEDGFEVKYGIEADEYRKIDLKFATLSLSGPISEENYITHIWYYWERNKSDGFIEFLIQIPDKIYEKDVEDFLFVIIPYSSKINTTGKKVAGRYPTEAILEMKAGDTVTVNKGGAEEETYMAVQAGNELFLIKKNR